MLPVLNVYENSGRDVETRCDKRRSLSSSIVVPSPCRSGAVSISTVLVTIDGELSLSEILLIAQGACVCAFLGMSGSYS